MVTQVIDTQIQVTISNLLILQYIYQNVPHYTRLYQGKVSLRTVHQQLPGVGPLDKLQGPDGSHGVLDV